MTDNKTNASAKRAACSVAIFAAALFGSPKANAQSTPASARAFVSQFYNWYVPQALQDRSEPTWRIPIREKAGEFSPLLVRLIRADSAAQNKCEDLVGLDFDPFLNSQDPARQYEVGEVTHKGRMYRAEIYSVQAGQRSSKPDVSASFERTDGRWIFVNFYYPEGGDLISILMTPKPSCSSRRAVHK